MRLLLPVALFVLTAGLTACGGEPEATRDEAGAVASAGAVDAFDIKLGDCMDNPVSGSGELEEVQDVKVVPCADPHDGEVYEMMDLPDGDFPGDEPLSAIVDEKCGPAFDSFVGMAYDDSVLDILTLQPTARSWAADDREVVCIVGEPNVKTTGTLKAAAR